VPNSSRFQFRVSYQGGIVSGLFFGAVFVLGLLDNVYEWAFHVPSPDGTYLSPIAFVGGSLFEGLVSLPFFYLAYRVIRMPYRVIDFYDEYLSVRGWKTKIQVPYSEVSKVELVPLPKSPIWRRRSAVKISVKGHEDLPIQFNNSKYRRIRTDAYSWLNAQVQQSAAATSA